MRRSKLATTRNESEALGDTESDEESQNFFPQVSTAPVRKRRLPPNPENLNQMEPMEEEAETVSLVIRRRWRANGLQLKVPLRQQQQQPCETADADTVKDIKLKLPLRQQQSETADADTFKDVTEEAVISVKRLQPEVSSDEMRFYTAMFAKPSQRKHKIWDDDGFIIISGSSVLLKDSTGELVESSSKLNLTEEMLNESKVFRLGNKDVQIQEQVRDNPFENEEKLPETGEGPVAVAVAAVNAKPVQFPPEVTSLEDKYYAAMFAKPSSRKHKIWEGDGFIILSGNSVVLKDSTGKTLGSGSKLKLTNEMLTESKVFNVGNKEVQILEEVSTNPFCDND